MSTELTMGEMGEPAVAFDQGRLNGLNTISSPTARAERETVLPLSLYLVEEFVVTVTVAPKAVLIVIVVGVKLLTEPPGPPKPREPRPQARGPKPRGPARRGAVGEGEVLAGLVVVVEVAAKVLACSRRTAVGRGGSDPVASGGEAASDHDCRPGAQCEGPAASSGRDLRRGARLSEVIQLVHLSPSFVPAT